MPGLDEHCRISTPNRPLFTHYLKGDYPAPRVSIIQPALECQLVLYVEYADIVCGISTFLYNFCAEFSDKLDIIVVYDKMALPVVDRIRKYAPIYQNTSSLKITCDTIVTNRLTDKIPSGISYNKSVEVIHACKLPRAIPPRDMYVNPSQAARDSWGDELQESTIIPNPIHVEVPPLLTLVSATRIGAGDKGGNDKRFRQLADKLERSGTPWIWLNFSDHPLVAMPSHFINMQQEVNIQNYIKRATYLVQLSQQESFSYSIVEALSNQTPVICCPMPVLDEIGVIDGVNAHVVPYDMDFDVNILFDVPEFKYTYDNRPILKQWEKLLKKPVRKKKIPVNMVLVEVTCSYDDIELHQHLTKGMQLVMPEARAKYLQNDHPYHVVKIIGE